MAVITSLPHDSATKGNQCVNCFVLCFHIWSSLTKTYICISLFHVVLQLILLVLELKLRASHIQSIHAITKLYPQPIFLFLVRPFHNHFVSSHSYTMSITTDLTKKSLHSISYRYTQAIQPSC